jgi:hypothetical protein
MGSMACKGEVSLGVVQDGTLEDSPEQQNEAINATMQMKLLPSEPPWRATAASVTLARVSSMRKDVVTLKPNECEDEP